MKKRILIVEDEFVEANNLEMILLRAGYQVCELADSVPKALKIIEKEQPDLVLLDIFLKGTLTGIDLAENLAERGLAFIYLSANSNKEILDKAKKTRPNAFLVKPFRGNDVLVAVEVALYVHQEKELVKQIPSIPARSKSPFQLKPIVGQSPALLVVLQKVEQVAATNATVLVLGENGTGKEGIVDHLHQCSNRSEKPLVKVNCAALPASLIESELFGHEKGAFTGALEKRIGKFEQADTGTLFLDEIGELPLDLQAKLLRAIQERQIERLGGKSPIKVDIRIIAATNKDLDKEVASGKFRMDLYYRLHVFPIIVPPLRDRMQDISILTRHFLKHFSNLFGLTEEIKVAEKAMLQLTCHNWPGNIRELEHLMERNVLLAKDGVIDRFELANTNIFSANAKLGNDVKSMQENEADHILKVLKFCKGKLSGPGGAAELLKIPYSTLTSRMKKLGITKDSILHL